MSPVTSSDAIAQSTQYLLNHLSENFGGTTFTCQDKWSLENDVLLALRTGEAIVQSYRLWQTRVNDGTEKFTVAAKERHREILRSQLDLLHRLEEKIREVQSFFKDVRGRPNYTVACGFEVPIAILTADAILKENWSPVAPISAAFEEVDLDDENADFFEKLTASAH